MTSVSEIRIPLAELPEGERRTVSFGDRQVTVFHVEGRFVAWHDRCPHQGGPVCSRGAVNPLLVATVAADGEVIESFADDVKTISCPWHGWEYDIATGRSLADPKRGLIPVRVAVDGDAVVVSL